jgi:hypothetical protein
MMHDSLFTKEKSMQSSSDTRASLSHAECVHVAPLDFAQERICALNLKNYFQVKTLKQLRLENLERLLVSLRFLLLDAF